MDISYPDLGDIHSVDLCKNAIRKVKEMKEALIMNSQSASNNLIPSDMNDNGKEIDWEAFFDNLPLLDIASLPNEDETYWLQDAPSVRDISTEELERDRGFMDSSLLNVQYVLLNHVKSAMFEQRIGMAMKESVETLEKTKTWDKDWKIPSVLSPSSSSGSGSAPESATISPRCPILASSPATYRVADREQEIRFAESNSPVHNEFYIATPAKNIDTRTYTRPKKIRTSLEPHLNIASGTNTLTLNRGNKGARTSIFNHNGSGNLNETFIHEDVDQSEDLNTTIIMEKSSRRVSRNLSYVIRRKSDSPCDNLDNLVRSTDELNTTFTRNPEESVSSPTDSNSSINNISMEELHNMARRQEQSLKYASSSNSPAVRRDTRVIMEFPILDAAPNAKPPVRTSSTDTYYIGESNPDSPVSSGLSSPIDSQSYNDISAGSPLGRSMPNLTMTKRSNVPRLGMSIAPPMNSLQYKNHYISDSKLSHPTGSPKLSVLKTHGSSPISKPIQDHSNKEMRISQKHSPTGNGNGYMKSMNQFGGGDSALIPTKIAQAPRSSLPAPRLGFGTQIRPPAPRSSASSIGSMLPAPGFISRLQSRIPAPGAGRGRSNRPPAASGGQAINSTRARDWRDGCY